MTATSTDTKPLAHAYTQFFYMIPAIIGSAVSFLIAGLLTEWHPLRSAGLSMVIGMAICLGLLFLFNQVGKSKQNSIA